MNKQQLIDKYQSLAIENLEAGNYFLHEAFKAIVKDLENMEFFNTLEKLVINEALDLTNNMAFKTQVESIKSKIK